MTKEELRSRLLALRDETDWDRAHNEADKALIEFIDDPEIAKAYWSVPRYS